MDTNGRILKTAPLRDPDPGSPQWAGNHRVVFGKDVSTENEEYPYLYAIWNTNLNKATEPVFQNINPADEGGSLISAQKNGGMVCLNAACKVIWQELKDSGIAKTMDIDFMNRGYFYASSSANATANIDGFGGWGGSYNAARPFAANMKKDSKGLRLKFQPDSVCLWAKEYKGIALQLLNNSDSGYYFDAQDSRLYMTLQAKDRKGKWRDIEYLPSSWCGNSYHTLYLAGKEYWQFKVPLYNGEFKTKIRARLAYKKTARGKDNKVIYSNTIDGSINPAQFWRRQEYYPFGIMDSYND
jgi:hypothetical protein